MYIEPGMQCEPVTRGQGFPVVVMTRLFWYTSRRVPDLLRLMLPLLIFPPLSVVFPALVQSVYPCLVLLDVLQTMPPLSLTFSPLSTLFLTQYNKGSHALSPELPAGCWMQLYFSAAPNQAPLIKKYR